MAAHWLQKRPEVAKIQCFKALQQVSKFGGNRQNELASRLKKMQREIKEKDAENEELEKKL